MAEDGPEYRPKHVAHMYMYILNQNYVAFD